MLKSVKNTILDIIRQADLLLLALCTVTSLFGVVMIYSATRYQGGLKCVIIQLCGLALGIVLYFVVSMVDLTEISKKWQWLLAFNLGFFLLLKTPLGVSANGNLAWLGVRGIPIQVQPAEVVKLTFILLLARQLVWMKGRGDMKSIPAVGLLAGNLLVTIGLYYVISSDMGSALVYVCIFACIVLYFVVSMVDLTEISKKWQWLLAFNLGFFLLLKTPLGVSANGNLAWLGVRGIPIQVQPAEVVKLTFILLLARQLVWMKGRGDMKSIPAVGLLAGNLLVTIGLYYVISSDMGSALVYVCIFACMAFAAGVALRWFALGIFGAGAGFYLLWELDKIPPYMKERFQVLVDHSLYPLGAGWQQTRSLMAIGGGRLTGQGLLHGAQTQSTSSVNLPFRHTDFIFAVIGEELGMLGCVLTLALLAAIVIRCIVVARNAKSQLDAYICVGVAGMLVFQIVSNVGMCLFVLPVVGLTLPFISYGGSSVVTLFIAMGMVSGIQKRSLPDWLR